MADKLLDVNGLTVSVEEKEILHDINLSINKGETHVLMGPNGAGKSTLGFALMGSPKYTLNSGEILFNGKNINDETPDKRSKDGIFLSFQSPLEVPGLSLSSFIRNALEKNRGKRIRLWDFKKELREAMELLQMDPSYSERDLNVGFRAAKRKKQKFCRCFYSIQSLQFLTKQTRVLMLMRFAQFQRALNTIRKNVTVRCSSSHTAQVFSNLSKLIIPILW